MPATTLQAPNIDPLILVEFCVVGSLFCPISLFLRKPIVSRISIPTSSKSVSPLPNTARLIACPLKSPARSRKN